MLHSFSKTSTTKKTSRKRSLNKRPIRSNSSYRLSTSKIKSKQIPINSFRFSNQSTQITTHPIISQSLNFATSSTSNQTSSYSSQQLHHQHNSPHGSKPLEVQDVPMTPRLYADPSTFPRRMMTYWFQDYERGKIVSDPCRQKWFLGHPVLDKYMVYEFGADYEAYKQEKLQGQPGPYSEIERHPLGALSLIILTTYYPRSHLRLMKAQNGGFLTPEMVVNSHYGPTTRLAHDAFLEMIYNSIQTLHPLRFDVVERLFFFLPLLQVENRTTQKVATARLSDLVEEAPRMHKPFLTAVKEFGLAHLDVIQQFNRFPQRNVLMGRESTPNELEYLKLHTSTWDPIHIYQFSPDEGFNNGTSNQVNPLQGVELEQHIQNARRESVEGELPTKMKNQSAWM